MTKVELKRTEEAWTGIETRIGKGTKKGTKKGTETGTRIEIEIGIGLETKTGTGIVGRRTGVGKGKGTRIEMGIEGWTEIEKGEEMSQVANVTEAEVQIEQQSEIEVKVLKSVIQKQHNMQLCKRNWKLYVLA